MFPRMPVICAAVMPGTESRRLTYAVRSAARAGELATGPGNWMMVSIGAVGLPGKSRFSVSVTTRGAALAGSTVASTPPQTTFRNGEPRASSSTTIGTAYSTGRRITLCANVRRRMGEGSHDDRRRGAGDCAGRGAVGTRGGTRRRQPEQAGGGGSAACGDGPDRRRGRGGADPQLAQL